MLPQSCFAVLVLGASISMAAVLPLLPRKTDSDDAPPKPTKVPQVWSIPGSSNFAGSQKMAIVDFNKMANVSVYSAGATSIWGTSTWVSKGTTWTYKQDIKFGTGSLEETMKVYDGDGKGVQKEVMHCDIDDDWKGSCVFKQSIKTVSDGDKVKYTATAIKMKNGYVQATPLITAPPEVRTGLSDFNEKYGGSAGKAYSSFSKEHSSFTFP